MDLRTPPYLAKQPSLFADTSPPSRTESSAPATPPSLERHKGSHRDGFSVKKCRDVLVRQCSWIPRNYNFKDGVNQVYEVLREYLGDENLDLAIAQLNELIEVPSEWPHDEGAPFQAWKHDYMLRHKDFENSHVPRLRNVIVAPVNPTERLKKWREDHPDRELATLSTSQSSQTPSSNSEIRPITPDYGIGTGPRRGNWRLENALFVSSRAQGTRVLHLPSAQELHKKTWNDDFGRGGKLVQERIVNLGEPVDRVDHTPDQEMPLKRKKSFADLRSMRYFVDVPVLRRIQSMNFVPEKPNASLRRKLSTRDRGRHNKQAKTSNKGQAWTRHHDPLLERFASEVKIYEGDPAVRDLPDPESDIGKPYYRNILTWPLPGGICVPSPRFARKHGLVPEEIPLPGGVVIKLVPTADEVAIRKIFQDAIGSISPSNGTNLAGPFTPELFKDGGIDFPQRWGNTEDVPASGKVEAEALSDMGALGDAAQSPSKHLQSINEGKVGFSSFSIVTGHKHQNPVSLPNELSCHPLKIESLGQTASAPKAMESNSRQWYSFTWKRCSKRPTVTRALGEPHLVLTHPLTDFTKAVQESVSKTFRLEEVDNSISMSPSKERQYFDILSLVGPGHSKNAAPTPAKDCAVMDPVNATEASSIIVSSGCNLGSNEIKADRRNGVSLSKEISEITVNHLACGSKVESTRTYDDLEKLFARNKHRRHETALLTTGNPPVVQTAINILDSTMIEWNTDRKSTEELALDLLEGTGYGYSEPLRSCDSSGAKKYKRVQNNNDNLNAESLSKRVNNNSKTCTTYSPEDSPDNSVTLIHKSEELSAGWLVLQKESEMDLNRDLPPLPFTTDSQSEQLEQLADQSQQESFESAGCTLEHLHPLYYDPDRDSLQYGGLHYHPDGMRYYTEVIQHPPRTSSMPNAGTLLETAEASTHHQVKAGENLNSLPAAHALEQDAFGPTRASNATHGSEGSSGIMGNFIPVKMVSSPSAIVTRAVKLPRIETDYSIWAKGKDLNSKPDTYEKAPIQVLTYSQKTPEKIDSCKVKDFDSVNIRQGLGGSIAHNTDHSSINLNDPEALAKYIKHLKKIKKQATEIEKQSLGPGSSLPRNFDGEAGRFMDNDDAHDSTVVDSDECSDAPHVSSQDYSEIRAGNPFAFESDDIQCDPDRTTTFTDFMGGANMVYERSNKQQSRKMGHFKNSHSESNAFYIKKRPAAIKVVEHNMARHVLQRSDSSPNIPPNRVASRRGAAQSAFQSFYEEDDRSYYQAVNHVQHHNDICRSPTRSGGLPGSSPEPREDVPESRETTLNTPSPSQKRPWSPVKKIFGEGGWLSSSASPKEEPASPKKPGLVEKIKLKIEEIGLKADLSPIKYPFKSDQEKYWAQSTFPISLNPAQQAEIYLDIELLICDSANTFLMNEYHNSRMTVDSLKKVTDFWKSKGRPQVVEFHYDQSTQRDLIVANQKTFRFYGPNANNPLKVHAMLYAWKTNAREMAVRTFCYPDSMIRRHIRDAFVILDFLGGHPFQYIAAHEVQKKLVGWINEANSHMATRSSGQSSVPRADRHSNEPPLGLVIDNPWHSASKPIQRPKKQSSGPGGA